MKFYPHKFKLILTASCLFIFLNIGIITVLPVTTLLDLAFLLDSTYSKVSVALTFYSVSALIGSLTGKFEVARCKCPIDLSFQVDCCSRWLIVGFVWLFS